MGEISDMMINGEMCAACGEYLHDDEYGEAEGFPRYCSESCSNDRGIDFGEENIKISEIKDRFDIVFTIMSQEADNLQILKKIKKSNSLRGLLKQLEIFINGLK